MAQQAQCPAGLDEKLGAINITDDNGTSAITYLQKARDAYARCDYAAALEHYKDAEWRQVDACGANSIDVGETLHEIGLTLTKLGDADPSVDHYPLALAALEQSLAIRQDLLGPGHEKAAETASHMTMLIDKIRNETAVREERRRLSTGLGSDVDSVVSGSTTMSECDDDEEEEQYTVEEGSVLIEQARYAEAEEVLSKFVGDLRDTTECKIPRGGGISRMTSTQRGALKEMARLGQAMGKYDEARELSQQALAAARIKAAEKDYKDRLANLKLAECIAVFAEVLRKSHDLKLAEELHREALRIRRDIVSTDRSSRTRPSSALPMVDESSTSVTDPTLSLAESYTHLGCCLYQKGDYEGAHRRHRFALHIRVKALDFVHPLVSESLNYTADALSKLGPDKAGEGIPLALHAVEIRKVLLGLQHPAYAHALGVLASCFHAVGRSADALLLWEQCLDICASVFHHKHANLFPNLIGYGDALRATGQYNAALEAYRQAETIHIANFERPDEQLNQCRMKITILDNYPSSDSSSHLQGIRVRFPSMNSRYGNPVIVVTDVGRDVDDELALCLLAPLRTLNLLNPVAVITTLAPQAERARLARGTLDSLGLYNVPVGIGSNGGAVEGAGLECYAGTFRASAASEQTPNVGKTGIIEDGIGLMIEALKKAPEKSMQILCLASLTDIAELIRKEENLFVEKVREVVVMGGLMNPDGADKLEPDSAYNNNCDLSAARAVYAACQRLSVPTVTLTRWAAYGCPFSNTLLDELRSTKHLLAANIRNSNLSSTNKLWRKVNLPFEDPKREKLPARCDRKWFCERFLGTEETNLDGEAGIWGLDVNFFMYDPLALLSCVPAFRFQRFDSSIISLNGEIHLVTGLSATETGILDKEVLFAEITSLLVNAFENALPLKKKATYGRAMKMMSAKYKKKSSKGATGKSAQKPRKSGTSKAPSALDIALNGRPA